MSDMFENFQPAALSGNMLSSGNQPAALSGNMLSSGSLSRNFQSMSMSGKGSPRHDHIQAGMSRMSRDQLVALCVKHDLSISGSKSVLIDRIRLCFGITRTHERVQSKSGL